MMNNKFTYFSERHYKSSNPSCEKEYVYWRKLLGDKVISNLQDVYGIDFPKIVSSEFTNTSQTQVDWYECYCQLFCSKRWINEEIHFSKRIQFENFYRPLLQFGLYVLKSRCKDTLCHQIANSFASSLLNKFAAVSTSTLVFEVSIAKAAKKLKGQSAEEEYSYYNGEFLSDSAYWQDLLNAYPVLFRLIFECIDSCCDYYCQLVHRLNADHDKIVKYILRGKEFTYITSVTADLSDSHHHGSSVAILSLDNREKLVYKPRSLRGDKLFYDFISRVSKHTALFIPAPRTLDCSQYGWQEFVTAFPCASESEVEDYYYRFGQLIFGAYALNVTDLHLENVIASGSSPVIIDCETVMDNHYVPHTATARDLLNYQLGLSVLNSGLLPMYKFVRHNKGVNMGAINATSDSEIPIKIPVLKGAGTSSVHYEYEYRKTNSKPNLVRLNSQICPPTNYISEICAGFSDAYTYVVENKDTILRVIDTFKGIKVRHLIQDTQRYSMLLHTSLNPDFLQDGKDRQLFLCALFQNANDGYHTDEIVRNEIREILALDIPYFYAKSDQTALFNDFGVIENNYFQKSSLAVVEEKIQQMGPDDLKRQMTFIQLLLTDMNDYHSPYRSGYPFGQVSAGFEKKRESIKLAENSFNKLMDDVSVSPDGSSVCWLSMTVIGNEKNPGWQIRPLGPYLYDGYAGLDIFLRAFHVTTGNERAGQVADLVDNELFRYTDNIITASTGRLNYGAFIGEASFVYTYLVLHKLTYNSKYLDYAQKHSSVLVKCIENGQEEDILFGRAGVLVILVRLYQSTQKKEYIAIANQLADILIQKQEQNGGWLSLEEEVPLTGFAHGAAGIMYALTELYRASPRDDIPPCIHKALLFEKSQYVPSVGNWKDNRRGVPASHYMTAWCNGASGIMLSRLKMKSVFSEPIDSLLDIDIHNSLRCILSTFFKSDCLCHGNLGNYEILKEYLRVYNDDSVKVQADQFLYYVLQSMENEKETDDQPPLYGYRHPGFMTGIAGIGYALLRVSNESLPNILALEV